MKNIIHNFVLILSLILFTSIASQAQFIDSCSSCRNIEETEEAQADKGRSDVPFRVVVKLFEITIIEFYSDNVGSELDALPLPTSIYSVDIYRKQDLYFTLDLYKE